MFYKRYAIQMDMTGLTCKKAAEAVSEVTGKPARYNRAFNQYTVKDAYLRDWAFDGGIDMQFQKYNGDRIVNANNLYAVRVSTPMIYRKDFEDVALALHKLKQAGAIVNETTRLDVILESRGHTERSLQNLQNMITGKEDLISKAVRSPDKVAVDLRFIEQSRIIKFPFFRSTLEPDVVKSYLHLSLAMNNQAQIQNRISPKKTEAENEKYAFRTWLLRIGMIGDDFKTTRAIMMQNLEGNTAWKTPKPGEPVVHEQQSSEDQDDGMGMNLL